MQFFFHNSYICACSPLYVLVFFPLKSRGSLKDIGAIGGLICISELLFKYFKKLLQRNPNWKWELIEFFPTEKGFNFKWKATIPIGTEQIVEYGRDIVELDPLDKRKIKRNEVYFDRTKIFSTLKKSKL